MWTCATTLLALLCAAAVLNIAASQSFSLSLQYLSGDTLELYLNNVKMVTLAPCGGTPINIKTSDSVAYTNNVIYVSSGQTIPGITQFYALQSSSLTQVSSGGQLFKVSGKLYAQVPYAFFVASTWNLKIDTQIATFVAQKPTITTSVQGTYITLQNVPATFQTSAGPLQGAIYTFGPFNNISPFENYTVDAQSPRYTMNAINGSGTFTCFAPNDTIYGPGLMLSNNAIKNKFFTTDPNLIGQITDANTKSIYDTFQFRYSGSSGTGDSYITSNAGADLILLSGVTVNDYRDVTKLTYQDGIVTFDGAGPPSYVGIDFLTIFDGTRGLEPLIRSGPSAVERVFSTTGGTVLQGGDSKLVFTTTPLVSYITGGTDIVLNLTGTLMNVTRGNLILVEGNSGSSYKVPTNVQVLHTGTSLQVGGGDIISLNGIKKLSVLRNKVLSVSFLPVSTLTLYGPGLLLYGSNSAFFTTDEAFQNQFVTKATNVLASSLGFAYTGTGTNLISRAGTTILPLSGQLTPIRVPYSVTSVTLNTNKVTFSPPISNGDITATSFSFQDGPTSTVTIATPGQTYPVSGGGTLYTSGSSAFYSTAGQLDSLLAPPYTVSQSLSGTSLTVYRGNTPLITSSTTYSIPSGSSLSYRDRSIVATDSSNKELFRADSINSLTTTSGQQLLTSLSTQSGSPLTTPGLLVYNASTGLAFYTTDQAQISSINGAYGQLLSNTFGTTTITTTSTTSGGTATPSGGTATVLTGGGQNLLQINGASSQPVPAGADQAVYLGNTVNFVNSIDGSTSLALPGVNTFSYFTGAGLVTLNGPGNGQVVPVQGGQVFTSQDKAFFTPSQQVTDYVNSIPSVTYSVSSNALVLTNGNSPVGTYSQFYNVPAGAQLVYHVGGQLSIVAMMGMGTTTTSLSGTYPTLTAYDGKTFGTVTSPTTLQGMGQLYYDQGQQTAHYVSSAPVITALADIYKNAYGSTFTFSYSSVRGTTQTTLRSVGGKNGQPAAGQSIVQLGAKPVVSVPSTTDSLTFQNNTVTFAGTDQTATYPTFPATTSLVIFNNTLSTPLTQGSNPVPILGGGAVYTDGTSVFYTAHQQIKGFLDAGVAAAPAPSATYFQVTTDKDTSASYLQADGLKVLTVTGSASQDVPYGSTITYSGGTVTVRNTAGQSLLTVPNQSQLTVTDTNGVRTTVYQGSFPSNLPKLIVSANSGGKVYTNGPQTFFTTSSAVISTVDQAVLNPSTPSFQVVLKSDGTQTGTTTLTVGPNQKTVIPLSGAQTFSSSTSTILYNNGTLSVLQPGTVLSGNPIYTGSIPTPSITLGTSNFPVTSLLVYDGVNLTDITSSTSATLTPGGTLYQSAARASLYINPSVTNLPSSVVTELQQRSTVLYSQDNLNTLQTFNGRQLVTFQQSAPYLINGGGTYYIRGDQAFVTSSPALIKYITSQSSSVTDYGFSSVLGGTFNVTVNGRTVFSFSPGATVISLQPTDAVTYLGRVISSASSLIARLPVAASSLAVDSGFGITTYNMSALFPVRGPGILIITSPTATGDRSAFLSLSPALTQVLEGALDTLTGNYTRPVIATPKNLLFASHYRQVGPPYLYPQFGQQIRVYESADVTIGASVTEGNPTPKFTFYKYDITGKPSNFSTSSPGWVKLPDMNSSLLHITTSESSITIPDVTPDIDAGWYQVIAQNTAGSAYQVSQLIVNPPAAPSVGTAFLIAKVQPGQQVIQVTQDPPGPAPPTPPTVNVVLNAVTNYLVNCKGGGRPRADITWTSNGITLLRNISNSLIVDPKQGTSYLNVSVSATDLPSCTTYQCKANNIAGTSTGSVRVCTQRYSCNNTATFSECTVTCGTSGYQVEILVCKLENVSSVVDVKYGDIPNGYIQTPPRVVGGCGKGDCPVITYQYEVSSFGPCSVTCGGGTQVRNASCVQLTSLGGSVNRTIVPDIQCRIAGKSLGVSLLGACSAQACPKWSASSYGACSVTCGSGVQTRVVQCANFSDVYNDSACLGQTRPSNSIKCSLSPCTYAWAYSNWGPCTPDCYVGKQNRSVFCVDASNPYTYVTVNDTFCTGLIKPADVNRCGTGPCPGVGVWLTSSFSSECTTSSSCGSGVQTRSITCVDLYNQNTSSIYCNPDTKPSDTLACFKSCPSTSCTSEASYCAAVPKTFCGFFSTVCCLSCPPLPTATPTATPTTPQVTPTPIMG